MRSRLTLAASALLFTLLTAAATSTAALAQLAPAAASRGELLYTTHCIACHTTQVHWRSSRLVTDWAGLLLQVRRWQAAAALQWSDADITEVARHLNNTTYRFAHDAVTLR